MANLITIARLILLFVVIAMIHFRPVELALPSMILLGVVFAGDGIDGWVARKRGSTSPFGAVFDIAGDRIVETVLWVYFAWERVIPLWVPFLVIVRGGIVDALRSMSYDEGMTAFGENTMMRSAFTRWLTAGRFMRGLYGYVKAAAFIFLTGYYGYIQPQADRDLAGQGLQSGRRALVRLGERLAGGGTDAGARGAGAVRCGALHAPWWQDRDRGAAGGAGTRSHQHPQRMIRKWQLCR